MYKSMEDQGQHYDQCVMEVKGCKLLTMDINDSVGNTAVVIFNDNCIEKIIARYGVPGIGYEHNGRTESFLLIKN